MFRLMFPTRRVSRMIFAPLFMGLALVTSSANAADRIVLTGSSTVAPLAEEIGKRFESLHRGARVDVQTGGSSRGIHDARDGLADIGMVSRSLNDNERDLGAYTIAYDGIAIILQASNPVKTLTDQQIADIYTGKVRDWSQVGPGKGTIVVENRAEGRSELDLFLEHFKLKAEDIRADILGGENAQTIKVVAGNPLAIGYVSVGAAVYEASNGTAIRPLSMDGVEPTVEAVAARKFPIMRELNLVLKGPPAGLVKQFLAFAQSEDVNDLINDFFFVPAR